MKSLIRKLIKAGMPVCIFPTDSQEAILEARAVYASVIQRLKNGTSEYVCYSLVNRAGPHTEQAVHIFASAFISEGISTSGTVFKWLFYNKEATRIMRSAPHSAAFLYKRWNIPAAQRYSRDFRIAWVEEMRRMFNTKVRKERKSLNENLHNDN